MTKIGKNRTHASLLGLLSTLTFASVSGFAQESPVAPEGVQQPDAVGTTQAPVLTQQIDTSSAKPVAEAHVAAQQPVAVGMTPIPTAVQGAVEKPEEAAKKADFAGKLAIGEGGGLKLSGVVQVWGVYQNQTDIDDTSDHASTVRLRRAEIKVSGDLLPEKFSFGVMIDAAKIPKFGNATVVTPAEEGETEPGTAKVLTAAKDNSLLQDAYVTYHSPWFELSAGQFKTPISYESATSSSKLLLPERAAVVRAYGEQRDLGVKLEKKHDYVGFVLGAFNGAGINRTDDNMQKDLALRLEVYPIKGLTVGGVGYASVGQRDKEEGTKDRLEGDIALQMGELVAQGEYIHSWVGAEDDRLEGAGWYGTVGYTVAKVLQPVVRVGQLDTDVDTEDNTATTVDVGVNYFALKDTVKLQLAYSHTGYEAAGADALSEVTLAGQFKF